MKFTLLASIHARQRTHAYMTYHNLHTHAHAHTRTHTLTHQHTNHHNNNSNNKTLTLTPQQHISTVRKMNHRSTLSITPYEQRKARKAHYFNIPLSQHAEKLENKN